MRTLMRSVVLPLGIGGAAFAFWAAYTPRAHDVLPTYGRVPAFALVDQDGQPISLEDLRGHIWIADFIFTRCAGQCPMMSAQMARLARAFQQFKAVNLVSFTVDPDWDTPEVLADYSNAYGASSSQWRFVTGDKQAIFQLCQEGFRLSVADGQPTPEEPITHSVRLVLVDREGQIRGYYDATDETQRGRLHRDLRRLLRELS